MNQSTLKKGGSRGVGRGKSGGEKQEQEEPNEGVLEDEENKIHGEGVEKQGERSGETTWSYAVLRETWYGGRNLGSSSLQVKWSYTTENLGDLIQMVILPS